MASARRETAEGALRVAISRGALSPGHRLVEAELAERIGVNRSSVRPAIDVLIAEGLVERIPNRGARVRVVSIEEAAAITAAALVGRLQAQLVRHQFRLSLRPGRPRVSLREMTAVVDAVAARDPGRAETAAVAHVRSVIAALCEPAQNTGGSA